MNELQGLSEDAEASRWEVAYISLGFTNQQGCSPRYCGTAFLF